MWIQTHRCLVCMHSLSMQHLQKHINQDKRYKKGDKAKIRTQQYIKLNNGAKKPNGISRFICVGSAFLLYCYVTTFFLLEILPPHIRACADPENLARGGPTLTFFFVVVFFYEGREGPNSTKRGPSSARQRNAI